MCDRFAWWRWTNVIACIGRLTSVFRLDTWKLQVIDAYIRCTKYGSIELNTFYLQPCNVLSILTW